MQPLKNVLEFYGTRRFITAFTRGHYCSLSSGTRIDSTPPNSIFLRSILILSTHQNLYLLSGLFPSWLPLLPIRATCPRHLILLDLIILIILGKEYSYEALHCETFSNLRSLHPFSIQIFSSETNVLISYTPNETSG
jgi:hypothetical protein